MLTDDQLAGVMQCPVARAARWNPALTAAMKEFGIIGGRRIAHFLAQIGHESLSLSRTEENLSYSQARLLEVFGRRILPAQASAYVHNPKALGSRVYANRLGNGNESSGDGYLFRGRGPSQLTFRNNYRRIGELLKLPLEEQPGLMLEIAIGARAAAAYWKDNGFNALADANNTVGVSKKWNLGSATSKATPEGLSDRITRTNRALSILGG